MNSKLLFFIISSKKYATTAFYSRCNFVQSFKVSKKAVVSL